MTGDKIPDSHHISRLCQPKHVPDGRQIQASAFMLRSGESGLSVNWLELLDCSSRDDEIDEIRKLYSLKFNRIGAKAKIAILNVGEVREKVKTETEDNRNLEVLHEPINDDPPDPSHSEMYNLKPDQEFIAELILETIQENHPARH